jgi:hypothetical protein
MHNLRTRIFSLLGICLLGTVCLPVTAAEIEVYVDGVKKEVRFPPILRAGRTLVHLREAFEVLGVVVRWDPTTKSLSAWRSENEVFLKVGSKTARVNGKAVTLDQAPLMHRYPLGEGMVVPMRFISQSFGCKVRYDATENRVYIDTEGTGLRDSETPLHAVGARVEYLTAGKWYPARVLKVFDWDDKEDNYTIEFRDKSGRQLRPTVTRRFLRKPH